nr:immunoglobulin heavy chain junction region [Macaca mulatta]
CATLMIW